MHHPLVQNISDEQYISFVHISIAKATDMATAVLQPQAVSTTLNYHLEPERGGAEVWCMPKPAGRRSRLRPYLLALRLLLTQRPGPGTVRDKRRPHDHQDVTVTNIRGHEADFSLDVQGFEVGPFQTSVADVADDKEFTGQYYQDVIAHMKRKTGATRVVPVVHIVRRLRWDQVFEAEKELPDSAPVTAPTSNRSGK